jgi:asparagine synthase (glutamine-hydrolysing)
VKAFAGIVTRDGSPVTEEHVRGLAAGIARTSDHVSFYRDKGVVLIQAIDPALQDRDSSNTESNAHASPLVGDVRIDNRHDVVRRLALRSDTPDDELIRRLLDTGQDPGLDDLAGDFAFAIWDPVSRTLTGGRDHFGVRPFYYTDAPQFFAFASSVPALLAVLEDADLDATRIAQYLELHPADEDRTFYRFIKRLPRAHRLVLSGAGLQLHQYWSPDEFSGLREPGPDGEVIDRLRHTFVEAVRCRVDTDLPVGSFLSGGLDSSSVAATARSVMPSGKPLYTFSAIFPGLDQPYRDLVDESAFIGLLTQGQGYESSMTEADRLTPLEGLEELLEIHGQPIDPPNAYLDYALYGRAADGPARVVLDGLEGDVTLSHGIHYLDELAVEGDWSRFFREADAICSRLSGDRAKIFTEYALPHIANSPRGRFIGGLPGLWSHGGARPMLRALKRRARTLMGSKGGSNRRLLISPDLQTSVDWNDATATGPIDPVHSEQEAHIGYLSGSYIPSVLEFTHANARHFGLEARHPMFDIRLVKLAVGMRSDLKLREGWNRYALREAMAGIVPDDVRWRPEKATLAPNFDLKMAIHGKKVIDGLIQDQAAGLGQYVDVEAFRDLSDRKRFRRLWPALVLALYLKKSV